MWNWRTTILGLFLSLLVKPGCTPAWPCQLWLTYIHNFNKVGIRKRFLILVNSICIVLPGHTAWQSVCNLYSWLDAVAIQMNLQHAFVFDQNNVWVPGCFQHLRIEEETDFRQALNRLTKIWGHQAVGAMNSCGTMLEVGGSGRGSLLMSAYEFGPLQGQ